MTKERLPFTCWFDQVDARSPLPLALLRLGLGVFVLLSPEPYLARSIAQHAMTSGTALLLAPEGLSWFVPLLGRLAPHLHLVHWMLSVAAVTTALGLFTRTSLTVLSITFFILFGTAQLSGTVTHNMHLLWFMLLLLAGPHDIGLSVDAWRKNLPQWDVSPSRAASLTLLFARLLLGCVYFFPGIAKLREAGLNWASSDNLANQMRLKWYLAGEVPWPRIDHWPTLIQVGGMGVLAFELSFVLLIWFRWGRLLAVLGGLSFHFLAAHFLYIHFVGLWGCYVVLWDGPRRATHTSALPLEGARRLVPPALLGTCLTLATIVQGARGQTQAWPFACYPDFAQRPASHVTDLAAEVLLQSGEWQTWRPPQRRVPQEWGTVWKILGLYDRRPDRKALRAYVERGVFRSPLRSTLAAPLRMRVFAEDYSTAPEAYGNPPLRRRLVLEQDAP